jgi:hypothetical protein
MARAHGVALEAEEAVAASARRYVPSIPTYLESHKQQKVYERAVTSWANT